MKDSDRVYDGKISPVPTPDYSLKFPVNLPRSEPSAPPRCFSFSTSYENVNMPVMLIYIKSITASVMVVVVMMATIYQASRINQALDQMLCAYHQFTSLTACENHLG